MMSLPDGTSFMSDIQDYMKYIIKKQKSINKNSSCSSIFTSVELTID